MARGEDTGRHPNRQVSREELLATRFAARKRSQAGRVQQTIATTGSERTSIANAFDKTTNPDGLEHQLYRGFFKRQQVGS